MRVIICHFNLVYGFLPPQFPGWFRQPYNGKVLTYEHHGAAGAPLITRYWKTSGHGSDSATPRFGRQLECEDCHDLNIQSGEGSHAADNSTGNPPNNINSQDWPNKDPRNGNTNPNVNTSHLVPAYIGSGTDAAKAGTFDDFCYNRCHFGESVTDHRHTKSAQKDMLFGRHKTTLNPKQYNWYSQSTYSFDFYKSWSPWVIQDTTTASFPYSARSGRCLQRQARPEDFLPPRDGLRDPFHRLPGPSSPRQPHKARRV